MLFPLSALSRWIQQTLSFWTGEIHVFKTSFFCWIIRCDFVAVGQAANISSERFVDSSQLLNFAQMKTLHVLDDHCSSVRSVCVHTISESDTSVTVHMATAGSRGALNIYHVTILTHSPPNDVSRSWSRVDSVNFLKRWRGGSQMLCQQDLSFSQCLITADINVKRFKSEIDSMTSGTCCRPMSAFSPL